MTRAERRAVVERVASTVNERGLMRNWCLWGAVFSDAGDVCLMGLGAPWRVWPSEEAFVAHARAQGLDSVVLEESRPDGTAPENASSPVVQFPDGVVMEVGEEAFEGQWSSLEAFELDKGARPCRLFRWHPAPESAEELAQASAAMKAVKALARRLAEHGLLPEDPMSRHRLPETVDGIAEMWTREAFRALRKQVRTEAPAGLGEEGGQAWIATA